MDVDALGKGIGLFSSALGALKQAIELLPDTSRKADATLALERAEREFKIAEAEAASRLDYQLCRAHFPSEIMLSSDNVHWKCPKCTNTTSTAHSYEVVKRQPRSRIG